MAILSEKTLMSGRKLLICAALATNNKPLCSSITFINIVAFAVLMVILFTVAKQSHNAIGARTSKNWAKATTVVYAFTSVIPWMVPTAKIIQPPLACPVDLLESLIGASVYAVVEGATLLVTIRLFRFVDVASGPLMTTTYLVAVAVMKSYLSV